MKALYIILILLIALVPTATAVNEAEGYFTVDDGDIQINDIFHVTFHIDTNYNTTSFVIRQLLYNANKLELINVSFENHWDTEMCDTSIWYSPPNGNLTYTQSFNFTPVSGDHPAFTMQFKALASGNSDITLPATIWTGHENFEVFEADEISYTSITIPVAGQQGDDDDPPPPPPPPPPPDDDDDDNETDDNQTEPEPNIPPVAIIDAPINGTVDQLLYFNGSASYDPDGNITRMQWYFGDGEELLGDIRYKSYAQAGIYNITLVVKDDDNAVTRAYHTIEIVNATEPPDNQTDDNTTPPPPKPEKDDPIILFIFGVIIIAIISIFIVFKWRAN